MYKSEKLTKEIFKALCMIKENIIELNDFFLNFTHIYVSIDSRYVICEYTTSPSTKDSIIKYFETNTPYIKHLLLKAIKMRRFPNIIFKYKQ